MTCNYFSNYIRGITQPLPKLKETFSNEIKYLEEKIKQTPPNGIICEMGCGVGRPLNQLAKQFPKKKFYGIDYDSRMISLAKENQENNITYLIQDATETTFKKNTFDVTFSTYNLVGSIKEENLEKLFQEKKRITKPGGKIISLFWNPTKETIKFLFKYYTNIGVQLIQTNETELKTNYNTRICSINEIIEKYNSTNIKINQISEINPLWIAIEGEKNV